MSKDNVVFEIKATDFSPYVCFYKNKAIISGESRPENTTQFYQKVIEHLDFMAEEGVPDNYVFEMKFDYLNSSSLIALKSIFLLLKKLQEVKPIEVVWLYYYKDFDIENIGIEMSEITGVKIKLKKY